MIAWSTVEAAITRWVATSSGLGLTRVAWGQQPMPAIAAPSITMRLRRLRRFGQDWLTVAEAASPAPGAEIEHRLGGTRVVTLSLECCAEAGTGAFMAVALLEAVRTGYRLPSVHDTLVAAGVGVGRPEDVLGIDGFVADGIVFEPRATLDIPLWLASEVVETGTYIETVEIENEDTDHTFTITL